MKGIILAGGAGTRLFPTTKVVCKQLLPVYDKPMIYYPLSTMLFAGIRSILIISTPEDTPRLKNLLGDGTQIGVSFSYSIQESPRGLADAFILGRDFIGNDSVCLILGDNIFYGHDLSALLAKARLNPVGATVFGYYVNDPQRYGVLEFDGNGKVLNIEEKPKHPKSNYAVVGLYFYDNAVVSIADNLQPSDRGELEITDVNREYLRRNQLFVEKMGRGFAWLDTGTHVALAEATNFVKAIEERQGLKIACIEEIAFRMGFIDRNMLAEARKEYANSSYGEYLEKVLKEPE